METPLCQAMARSKARVESRATCLLGRGVHEFAGRNLPTSIRVLGNPRLLKTLKDVAFGRLARKNRWTSAGSAQRLAWLYCITSTLACVTRSLTWKRFQNWAGKAALRAVLKWLLASERRPKIAQGQAGGEAISTQPWVRGPSLPTAERDGHQHAGYLSRPNHAVAAIAAQCKPDTKCGPFRSRQRAAMAPRLGLDRAGVCAHLPRAYCAAPRAIFGRPIRGGRRGPKSLYQFSPQQPQRHWRANSVQLC
jgi:hypothetical protein